MMNVYENTVKQYVRGKNWKTHELMMWRPEEVYSLGFYSSRRKAIAAFVAMCDAEVEWHTHWSFKDIKVPEIDLENMKVRIEVGEEAILFIGRIEKHKVH